MKLHHDIAHMGTLDGEKERMGLDLNSLEVLQNMFIDLYSNKPLACWREYATNTWDSHVEAGNSDPIEIELPTSLRPVAVIRDHGTGLSFEEMRQVYFQYGASKKRDSDEFTGQLGMGSKSALTYTSQFTVTGIKDGIKVVVLVTRESDGTGAFLKIAEEPTDERNGVVVEIPVSNSAVMIAEANLFFAFWERGRVLVDGEFPMPYTEWKDTLEIDENVHLVNGLPHDYIVMGNVPYPCSVLNNTSSVSMREFYKNPGKNPARIRTEKMLGSTAYSAYLTFTSGTATHRHDFASFDLNAADRMKVVARVEIGGMNYTPNREAVAMTTRSEDVLDELQTLVRTRTLEMIQYDVDSAPTPFLGMKRATTWSRRFYRLPTLTYRGVKIPHEIRVVPTKLNKYGWTDDDGKAWLWKPTTHDTTAVATSSIATTYLTDGGYAFVTGFGGRGLREETKEKIRMWMLQKDYATVANGYFEIRVQSPVKQLVFLKDAQILPRYWLGECVPVVPYEEIRSINPPKAVKDSKVDKRWRVYSRHQTQMLTMDEDLPEMNLTYIMAGDGMRVTVEQQLPTIMDMGGVVVILPANRKAKFCKMRPDAEPFAEWLRRQVKELGDTISSEAALLMEDPWATNFNGWRPLATPSMRKRMLDSELADLLGRLLAEEPKARMAKDLFKMAGLFGIEIPDLSATRAAARRCFGTMKGRYPFMLWVPIYRATRTERSETRQLCKIINDTYIVQSQVHLDPRTY